MKRFRPDKILTSRPFMTGMSAAFDIYGASGIKMYDRIHGHWITIISHPRPTAEESIRESVATVNGEFLKLLVEHEG